MTEASPRQRTKKQHFVPRFLLSNFAEASTGCIHVFDFERAVLLPPQTPKDGFAKRFYYDRDNTVEEFLSKVVEGPAAPVIRGLLANPGVIPEHPTGRLVTFLGAQLGRTPAARAETENLVKGAMELMIHTLLKANGHSKEDAEEIELVHSNPRGLHAWRIAQAAFSAMLFLDLKLIVFENRTNIPFVLGDHPVIQYNWYLRNAVHSGSMSMTAPGVQVIMPVSSNRALCLYDSQVYDVQRPNDGLVLMTNPEDINLLNELQLRNRQRFVVTSSAAHAEAIGRRGPELEASSLTHFEQGVVEQWRKADDGTRRDLLYNHRVQHDMGRWLSVTPIRRDAPAPPTQFVHRNPRLLEAFERLEACRKAAQGAAQE